MSDMVNSPPHYTEGKIECIDAIEASMGTEPFRAYCKGNVMKYLWRYESKGGSESLRKAQWYLNRMLSTFASEPEPCPPAPTTSEISSRNTRPPKPEAKSASGRTPRTRSASGRGVRR